MKKCVLKSSQYPAQLFTLSLSPSNHRHFTEGLLTDAVQSVRELMTLLQVTPRSSSSASSSSSPSSAPAGVVTGQQQQQHLASHCRAVIAVAHTLHTDRLLAPVFEAIAAAGSSITNEEAEHMVLDTLAFYDTHPDHSMSASVSHALARLSPTLSAAAMDALVRLAPRFAHLAQYPDVVAMQGVLFAHHSHHRQPGGRKKAAVTAATSSSSSSSEHTDTTDTTDTMPRLSASQVLSCALSDRATVAAYRAFAASYLRARPQRRVLVLPLYGTAPDAHGIVRSATVAPRLSSSSSLSSLSLHTAGSSLPRTDALWPSPSRPLTAASSRPHSEYNQAPTDTSSATTSNSFFTHQHQQSEEQSDLDEQQQVEGGHCSTPDHRHAAHLLVFWQDQDQNRCEAASERAGEPVAVHHIVVEAQGDGYTATGEDGRAVHLPQLGDVLEQLDVFSNHATK